MFTMDSIYIYALQTLFSFIGAIIGGSLTLIGVLIANRLNSRENREHLRLQSMPYLVFTGYVKSSLNHIMNSTDKMPAKTDICSVGLELKNLGKGILKNLKITIYEKGNTNPHNCHYYQYIGLNEIVCIDIFKAKLSGGLPEPSALDDYNSIQYKNLNLNSEFIFPIKLSYQDVYDNPYKQEISMLYFIEISIDPVFSFADIKSNTGPVFTPFSKKSHRSEAISKLFVR